MQINLRQGSLTDGDESVLVNASNTNGVLGTGVSAAIHQACGRGYQQHLLEALQREFHGPMKPGDVLLTNAGTHPRAKWVAHVAVMDYRDGGLTAASYPTLDTIRRGCERLWEVIETIPGQGTQSVAMVALGAGTGNLGVAEPTRIAAETLQAHAASHPHTHIARVAFYGFQLPEFIAIAHVLVRFFPEILAQLPADIRGAVAAQR